MPPAPNSPTPDATPTPRGRVDALLVGLASLALLAGMVAFYDNSVRANGSFVFPLDDAYIHLGLARTLAEHGTWGINAGEFASATSSPLYTALLALVFLGVTDAHVPLVLNFLAGVALLALVATMAPPRARPLALGLVLVAGPLPFLASLGMEHVQHAALVLALARVGLGALDSSGDGAAGAPGSARTPALLAALGASAVLTRYESLFVVAPLALFLLGGRKIAAAAALLAGSVGAAGLFAAWSVAQGGLVLPNSILMKSALAGGWTSLWRANLGEGTAVFVLATAAGAAGLVADRRAERHLALFAASALLHLAFSRVGWLFRYEGYLVLWGAALVAPLFTTRGPLRARAALAAAVLLPLGLRAWDAVTRYVPATRTIHDNDVVLARMVERSMPDAVVGVHNIGALAWFTDATIVDLGGLATTEVTRLHLAKRLSPEAFGALIEARGVQVGWTDRPWLADHLPPGITEVAELAYTSAGGPESTRVWVTPKGDAAALTGALASGELGHARLRPARGTEVLVDLAAVTLEGPAVKREERTLAFYSSGAASFAAPADGLLSLSVRGTEADGRGPRFRVLAGDRVLVEAAAGPKPSTVEAGAVTRGEAVRLVYDDDLVDAAGNDRNLWADDLRVLGG